LTTLAVTLTVALPAAQADSGTASPDYRVPLSAKTETSKCPSARRAVQYYAKRYASWLEKRGAQSKFQPRKLNSGCPRYMAKLLQRKSRIARLSYQRWHVYHWRWDIWLPDKWQRIGACETGYGRRPGNWRHSNSSYEGAFGFAKSSWDGFKGAADPKAGPYPADAWQATPRQQYEVALAIYRRFGFSGWGCKGA
jgi:hypothetical protein